VFKKVKILSIAVAALVVAQSVNSFAIEPPNLKRITDADKVYFGTRLDKEQFDKLQQVINHGKMSKQPCAKAAEIEKTLRFLKEMIPIFQEAPTHTYLSSYARKYSSSLAQELIATRKALTEILPHSKKACMSTMEARKGKTERPLVGSAKESSLTSEEDLASETAAKTDLEETK
jgi:hypothetical protein